MAPGPGGDAGGEHPLSGDPAATEAALAAAVAALERGGLVAFPTETVYGLGADAESAAAVARIYAAKGRPGWHPVIVHGADASVLDRYARSVPASARRLAALWPGPLSLVLPRAERVPDAVTGGRDTVAVRVPAQPLALALLGRFGRGVAAPSANRFGRVSPTSADDVRAELGGAVDVILDGGRCAVGVESTIVDLTGARPAILRQGGVTREALAEALGEEPLLDTGPARASGMLAAHYQPAARVEIVAADRAGDRAAELLAAGERPVLIGPAPDPPPGVLRPPAPAGPAEYAHELYAWLRLADAARATVVLAVPPEGGGIAAAVRDRLARAAHRAEGATGTP